MLTVGTNYYLYNEFDRCRTCDHKKGPMHIGKSSAGWCFALHVFGEDEKDGPKSLEDWKVEWAKPGRFIKDEYGARIEPDSMLRIITERFWWGYLASEEELLKNCAKRGPHGLVRHTHRASPAPDDGTYDLCEGEFS